MLMGKALGAAQYEAFSFDPLSEMSYKLIKGDIFEETGLLNEYLHSGCLW
jgi:hypothetical protein